jgi:AdoMet-dependent rRNA methyltransferase SPB1
MTAPLDIGLEFQDQALGLGQDDILDLEMSKKQLGKKAHVDLINLVDNKDSFESDEEEQREDAMIEEEEILDPEEEEDKKVEELELELDGLYDTYQERRMERDAKYRVKEARRKDKSREEWHGIKKQDSDDDDDDGNAESGESEGGYDIVQDSKARFGEDSDSDSDLEPDDDLDVPSANKKLKRPGVGAEPGGRQPKKARTNQLETSQATCMWFDQEVFAGVDMTVSDDDNEDEDEKHDVEDEDLYEEDKDNTSQYEGSSSSKDDFEVAPQEDQDEQMWDGDHEDQDEINRSKIQGTITTGLIPDNRC